MFSIITTDVAVILIWLKETIILKLPKALTVLLVKPDSIIWGLPCSLFIISTSLKAVSLSHPVPRALKKASFAANRAA